MRFGYHSAMWPDRLETKSDADDLKDSVLNRLAPKFNIAQFVSFSPDLAQRYAWISGRDPNEKFPTLEAACEALLNAAESHALNIRSFKPGAMKGHKLIQNLESVAEAASALRERAGGGFFTIANEVVPLEDGGVSGVVIGPVIEFAPVDTPKCVDKPGVASLPTQDGIKVLKIVYGFPPELDFRDDLRIEFSLHPTRRGYKRTHTIIWEVEPCPPVRKVEIRKWPNQFSRLIGDKAYGLLIGHVLGFPVPRTMVVGRHVAPFEFGQNTGTKETWLRTCPAVPIPGKYPTFFGWQDPFDLMQRIPEGDGVVSILAQESVPFVWSGAARTTDHGPHIEGVEGRGDPFMIAAAHKESLPALVHYKVKELHESLLTRLRSVKFEWVWDGDRVWLLQLHQRPKGISEDIIYPGDPTNWRVFDPRVFEPEEVLDRLRNLVAEISGHDIGVTITGDVGVTSHIGDVLAEARIPSRLHWAEAEGLNQMSLELDEMHVRD